MIVIAPIIIGILFAGTIYLLLQRSITRLLLGIVLLSYAVHMLIFTMSGLRRTVNALAEETGTGEDGASSVLVTGDASVSADPLPQALAIVAVMIGLVSILYAMVLLVRVYQTARSDDVDDLTTMDTG
jgi:multicomponent Na+:H+ antiporter subunit C